MENNWIPTKERLPKKNGRYLVTTKKGYIMILRYSPAYWADYKSHPAKWYYGYYEDDWGEPTAWMELPESYKEK